MPIRIRLFCGPLGPVPRGFSPPLLAVVGLVPRRAREIVEESGLYPAMEGHNAGLRTAVGAVAAGTVGLRAATAGTIGGFGGYAGFAMLAVCCC